MSPKARFYLYAGLLLILVLLLVLALTGALSQWERPFEVKGFWWK